MTIHGKNLQLLMTEIFKTQHSFNPTFMEETFVSNNIQYYLRTNILSSFQDPELPLFEKSISLLKGILWHELSVEIKESLNLKPDLI